MRCAQLYLLFMACLPGLALAQGLAAHAVVGLDKTAIDDEIQCRSIRSKI
jgi:hypothetical protein